MSHIDYRWNHCCDNTQKYRCGRKNFIAFAQIACYQCLVLQKWTYTFLGNIKLLRN